MRRLLRRTSDERGIALIMALIAMAALAAGLTTVIVVSTSSGRTATRASADQVAYNAAEAGINLAMSVLHTSRSNALDPNALPSTTTNFPVDCTTDCKGRVTWGGVFYSDQLKWVITASGYAPTPGLPDRKRILTATSYVQFDLSQDVNNQIWNYIYSFGKGGPTYCDVHLEQNAVISAPIYAEGNLCMENNAWIEGKSQPPGVPPTPVNVVAKGKTIFGTKSSVGTSTKPVVEAHLASGCGTSFGNVHTPCTLAQDPIHAASFDTSPTAVTVPQPDFSWYYANANPGPMHPCNPATAVNPPLLDSDTNLNLAANGNAPAYGTTTPNTFDLTPATSYTCQGFDGAGNIAGEISWNATTRALTVSGVIYYDGNLTLSGVSVYSGQATIYATGWIDIPGASLCGAILSGACDYRPGDSSHAGWNPNETMLIVAVNGHDASNSSVNFSSPGAHWQGGLFANQNLQVKNGAVIEGPIIARYLDFLQNVTAVPFPVINTVPLGAPGNPNAYANALPPVTSG